MASNYLDDWFAKYSGGGANTKPSTQGGRDPAVEKLQGQLSKIDQQIARREEQLKGSTIARGLSAVNDFFNPLEDGDQYVSALNKKRVGVQEDINDITRSRESGGGTGEGGFGASLKRGLGQERTVRGALGVVTGIGDEGENLTDIAAGRAQVQNNARNADEQAAYERFQSADGFLGSARELFGSPSGWKLATQIAIESLPTSAYSIVGGTLAAAGGAAGGAAVGGPGGALIGARAAGGAGSGIASFAVEYGNAMLETMERNGIDIDDPEAIKTALANPKIMAEARDRGVKRGVAVGVFDALSFGLAGKMGGGRIANAVIGDTATATTARKAGGLAAGGAVETVAQGALGSAGEASGQLATEGRITSPQDIVAEFAGEVPLGVVESGVGTALELRRGQTANQQQSQGEDDELAAALNAERAATQQPDKGDRTLESPNTLIDREVSALDEQMGTMRVGGLNLTPTQIMQNARANGSDPRIANILSQPVSPQTKVEQVARILNAEDASRLEPQVVQKIAPLVGGTNKLSQTRAAIEVELAQVDQETVAESPVLSAMAKAVAKDDKGKYVMGGKQAVDTVRGVVTGYRPTAPQGQTVFVRPERGRDGGVAMTQDQVAEERQRERQAEEAFTLADRRQRRYESQTGVGGQREDLRPGASEPESQIFLDPKVYGEQLGGTPATLVSSETPGMVRVQYESPTERGADGAPVIVSDEVSLNGLVGRVIRGSPRLSQEFAADQRRPQAGVGTGMAGPRNSIDRTSSKSLTPTPEPGLPMAQPIEPNFRYEGTRPNSGRGPQAAQQAATAQQDALPTPAKAALPAPPQDAPAAPEKNALPAPQPKLEDNTDQQAGGEQYSGRSSKRQKRVYGAQETVAPAAGEAQAADQPAPGATQPKQPDNRATDARDADRAAPNKAQAEPKVEQVDYKAVIQDRLDKLAARGRQGKVLSNRIRSLVKDKNLTATQLYYAFQMGEVMSRVLPKNAGIDIIFVPSLTATDATAAANSATRVGEEIPGKVQMYEISQNGFRGLITMSLSDSVLSVARENAAHEAFHVVQDMLFAYDRPALEQINGSFFDGMRIDDLDASILRTLKTLSLNGETSVYESLKSEFGDTPFGSSYEAQAVAFGALVDAKDRGSQMKGLKASFIRVVDMIANFRREFKNVLNKTGIQSAAEIFDGYRTGKAQENLTERAPLVGEGGFNAEQYTARGVFPVPQRLFDQVGIPEEQRTRGGTYIDPKNREVFTGRTFGDATISINPETGSPSFVIDDATETEAMTPKDGTTVRTNLFKQKAGWKWVGDDRPAKTVVSVETRGKHFYTLATKFDTPVTLKSYPDAPSEPRLRPTTFGEITLGEQIGEIDVRGKLHPVYAGVAVHAKGVQYSGRTNPIRKKKPIASQPGKGVANGNMVGFAPELRVKVAGATLPDKPLVLATTNNKNAEKQINEIDGILDMFPDAGIDANEWSGMMAYALKSEEVPIPPYRFINDLANNKMAGSLERLSPGQIADASYGFENAREFRRAYISGELDVVTTGKLFMWSFLSRGVSPYTQESLFIDAFDGVDKWIKLAAKGEFIEANLDEYREWASSVAKKGSGQPGAGATHNLNAFGKDFLLKMGRKSEIGITPLQRLHDMMEKPEATGKEIRREFLKFGEGVGIDNKVVSFTLLVAGFNDVMVLDRVQIRQLWDDGRFNGRNLYDGQKNSEGNAITGTSLAQLTFGVRGLLVYEAVERALDSRLAGIYAALGRPQDASIGRFHWETWVADSQQEASHGTLSAILKDARGDDYAIASVSAKQGEYGAYEYGAMYARRENGDPYFEYVTPDGTLYQFDVPRFRLFLGDIKLPKTGVVPTKFKVTEAGNEPWYNGPKVNRDRLKAVAAEYGKAVSARSGEEAVPAPAENEVSPNGQRAAAQEVRYSGRTGSAEFKSWFRDSKIADTDGTPRVVYHGTTSNIAEFQPTNGVNGQIWGAGYYLTPEAKYASSFAKDYTKPRADEDTGGNVMPLYASLQNPLQDAQELTDIKREIGSNPQAITAEVKRRGYDGVDIVIGGRPIVVAYEPAQIKSAVSNNGKFDPEDARILYSGRTGSAEFNNWFGDSQVVSDSGEPVVVYTGTSKDTIFKSFKVGPRGAWFTTDPAEASSYAEQNDSQRFVRDDTYGASPWAQKKVNTASRVIPAHLKIENPKVYIGNELRDAVYEKGGEAYGRGEAALFRELIAAGHDGVQLTGNDAGDIWVVLKDPRQVKSIFNQTFDPKDVKYSGRKGGKVYTGGVSRSMMDKVVSNEPEPGIFGKFLDVMVGRKGNESRRRALVRNLVTDKDGMFMLDRMLDAAQRGVDVSDGRVPVDGSSVGRAMEMASQSAGVMQAALEFGPPVYSDDQTTIHPSIDGLFDIFAPIGEEKAGAFQTYAVARREKELRADGRNGFINVTDAEISETLLNADPEFVQVFDRYQEFNQAILDYAIDTGLLTSDLGDKLKSMAYVPYYRAIEQESEEMDILGPVMQEAINNPKSALNLRLKGGEAGLGNLYENLIRNTQSILSAARKNLALQEAADAIDGLNAMGITGIGQKVNVKLGEGVMTLRVDGEPAYYKIEDLAVWVAIASLKPKTRDMLTEVAAKFAGVLRTGITLSPAFMVRNLWRGKFSAFVTTDAKLSFGVDTLKGMADAYKGGTATQMIKVNSGMGGYTYGQGERSWTNEIRRKYRRQEGGGYGAIRDWQDKLKGGLVQLEKIGEATEMAERVKLYNDVLAKGASEKTAAYEAMNLTNFGRKGAGDGFIGWVTSGLIPAIPFLNARIQGLYRIAENQTNEDTIMGLRRQVMFRGLLLTAASLAIYAVASDDDRWDEESTENKMLYDIFYVGDYTVRLPRAFEVGTLFSSMPIAALDYIRDKDGKEAGRKLKFAFMNTFALNPLPAATLPTLGAVANYNWFTQRPIDGMADLNLPAAMRYESNTSEIAKAVGRVTNVSPKRLDYVLEGHLGTMGGYFTGVMDTVLAGVGSIPSKPGGMFGDPYRIADTLAEVGGMTSFVRESDRNTSRFVRDFYEIKTGADQAARAHKVLRERGETEAALELLKENRAPIAARTQLGRLAKQLTAINKMIDSVETDRKSTPAEKALKLKSLMKRRKAIARQGYEYARGIKTAYSVEEDEEATDE